MMVSMIQYLKLRSFLEKKTFALFQHENDVKREKGETEMNMYQEGFSIDNCYICEYNDISIYFVFNDAFWNGATSKIEQANIQYPDMFGTRDARDVLDALYRVWNSMITKEEFVHYLKEFACCYVIFEIQDDLQDNVLRIDMFRKIEENKKDRCKFDFTSGLLHALKHFSLNGRNLSIGMEVNDVQNVIEVLILIAKAFVYRKEDNKKRKKKQYLSYVINNGKHLRFSFYKEDVSGVYFLNTSHLKSRNKKEELQLYVNI